MMAMGELLKKLTEAAGVSGAEGEVRAILQAALEGRVDEMRVDALGNLIVLRRGTGTAKLRVMLAAHMDEVGLMVTRVEGSGHLRFRRVGGIDERILPAKGVVIGKDKLPGIIGIKPIHLMTPEEGKRIVRSDEMTIDIGASSREEAERWVKLGDYASFATSYQELPPDAKGRLRAKGKAFDDRAGCAALVELLGGEYPFDLWCAFTVQEEVGLRGAQVAGYSIAPDLAFALEGTVADDLPKKKDTSPVTQLGKGPAITIMDRALISDKRLVRLLVDTAEEEGIPYQIKQPGVGATDAGSIQLTRGGVPSVTLALPCRYLHSPACFINLADYGNMVRLMGRALPRLVDRWP